jgi:hypothetical protein
MHSKTISYDLLNVCVLFQGLDGLCAVITEINHAYLPLCVPNSLELESLKTGKL